MVVVEEVGVRSRRQQGADHLDVADPRVLVQGRMSVLVGVDAGSRGDRRCDGVRRAGRVDARRSGLGCGRRWGFRHEPVSLQERQAAIEPVRLGPVELAAHHLGRRLGGVAEPLPPDPAVTGTQPVLEEQLQVAVVPSEHPVVERLPVVRVRAALEEEPGQRLPLGVPRLAARALLALAEAAGQRGERRGQALPQVAGGRVGAGVEEQPGRRDGVALRDPGVDEVDQGYPAERAAVT